MYVLNDLKDSDIMAIDSHMHINHAVLNNVQEYIDDINNNSNIESVVNIGLNIDTSKESISITRSNQKFYSTIGVHPLYIENEDINKLYELFDNDKVVAVGEIGLDTTNNNLDNQRRYLINQIMIANELHLPVVIHSNNTNKIIIEIFEKIVKPIYGCVFHCFQPDIDDLNYLISNGYYISFAGRVTYKTAQKSIEVAKLVPDELFLVETDSPYISPEPLRGDINKSRNISCIIKRLSEIREMSYEEVESITTQNAKRLFRKIK